MNENFTEKVKSVVIKHGGTVRCKNTDSEGRCTYYSTSSSMEVERDIFCYRVENF